MSEDDQDELGKKFGLPVDQGGSKHSTRSVGRKNKKSRKKNPRKKQKKTKPGRKNKHRRPKRTSCSKDRLFLNFKELGWDVSITLHAPNVQHLNSPKKCCTLGTLLHIGDIALEK